MIIQTLRTVAAAVAISAVTGSVALANEETPSDEDLLENAIRFDRDEVLEERQDARAQFLRGLLFAYGRTVETDFVQAANWFRRAVEKGYAPAEYSLGIMYAKGRGVPSDPRTAARLFESAAIKGLAAAQHNFAVMLAEGEGRPRDLVSAYAWFTRAGENLEISRQYRDRIEPFMTDDQIAAALQIAGERGNGSS